MSNCKTCAVNKFGNIKTRKILLKKVDINYDLCICAYMKKRVVK